MQAFRAWFAPFKIPIRASMAADLRRFGRLELMLWLEFAVQTLRQ